jgi:acetyl-CoA acetyltransferase
MTFRTPVIVGVGDCINRSVRLEDALEPLVLINTAINNALTDAIGQDRNITELQRKVDSIDVVSSWTWPYPDIAGLVADKIGVKPRHVATSAHGGNQPAKLLDEAARRIAKGESEVAVICGGEALASRMFFHDNRFNMLIYSR